MHAILHVPQLSLLWLDPGDMGNTIDVLDAFLFGLVLVWLLKTFFVHEKATLRSVGVSNGKLGCLLPFSFDVNV